MNPNQTPVEIPAAGKLVVDHADFFGTCFHCGIPTMQVELIKEAGKAKGQIVACLRCGKVQSANANIQPYLGGEL